MTDDKDSESRKRDLGEDLEQGTEIPRNLVEVETSSETWKTEFEKEISAIRINGEEVIKLHNAVSELRALREKSNRSIKRLMTIIILLIITSLAFCLYAFDYLLQFNIEKIDQAIDLNIETIEKSRVSMVRMPTKSLAMLKAHKNEISWDNNLSTWVFLNSFNGKKEPLTNDYFFYNPARINDVKAFGLHWNGYSWQDERSLR
jgi:hypothetical protein